jgi:(2Fe-2S) ferredoxin
MSSRPARSTDWESPPIAPVPRFAHGSRVPGWDDAVDLTKDPAVVPDPATTPVPEDLREKVEAAMARYPDRRSASIPALHAAQEEYGWCSPEAIEQVAAVMRVTPAYLTSVATFYDIECLGACDIAPMASVNGEYVGPLVPADARRIVEDLRAGGPVLAEKQLKNRLCADPGAAGQ